MALPWTQPDPERKSQGKFACDTCWGKTARGVLAGMHCGWMPRAEWTPGRDGLPKSLGSGAGPYTVDVCPGWLVRQPAVIEGAAAYSALEANVLDRFDPENLRVVNQAALVTQQAFNLWQIERQRQLASGAKRGA